MSSLSTSLKNSYQRWLCPYEEYLRVAKPGVHQQLEQEYGGPLTPSPAQTPVKRSHLNSPSGLKDDSPARQASEALQNGLKKESDRDTPMVDAPPAPTSGGSGFTAVNRISSNTPDPTRSATPVDADSSSLGIAASLKRQQNSADRSESAKKECDGSPEEGDGSSRRSKRLKKESVPTVAGSHMTQFRPSAPRIPREEDVHSGDRCESCGRGDEGGNILICDSCDNAYHTACLDAQSKRKLDTEWNCPRCLVGDGQFGFEEGGLYSLKQFQQKANDFKQGYFENKMPFDSALNCHRPVTEEDVENEFWRLVGDLEETVEVEYGADIHCTTHGSGFPTIERHPTNPYSSDPWNLNVLPLHSESLFRHINSDISGMTVPWVYVGMIFSTFCWHNEDHYAYSANYQHFGATKTWYGIPGDDAEKFEAAMREAVPELFETQPDLLFQLVTLLTPEQLTKAGVRVYAIDQRAGQFVITFPQAYHAGFNHGFNFNEAVNFAPSDWEPYGLAGVERLQAFRRQPCFSHDELLWTAGEGASAGLTISTAKWLAPALDRIRKRELAQRHDFIENHLAATPHRCQNFKEDNGDCRLRFEIADEEVLDEEEQCCSYCKAFAFLSRFKCQRSGKVLCIVHAGYHACCDSSERERFAGEGHYLIFRKTESAMDEMYQHVIERAETPDQWEDKYEKLLDEETTPSLKVLRALLHEGERVPFELPSLPILKEFVDRCNDWVEEATTYIVRKQQNRRKSEKGWPGSSRRSVGSSQHDQKTRDSRNVSNIDRLLQEAERLGFDCPEVGQLQERAASIKEFQNSAAQALKSATSLTAETIEELIDEGRSFNVDIPEVDSLTRVLDQMRWNDKARSHRGIILSLNDVQELIEEGRRLEVPAYNDHFKFYSDQLLAGQNWEAKAKELIHADMVHYPQLEALSSQAQASAIPVSAETLAAVDQILHKQREAQRLILDLTDRSRNPDFHLRPKYTEVVETSRKLEELNSKPAGTMDLENERKRHEDWMRKGKKLFGKSNAPLHILKSHLEHVLERNQECFDEKDTPRLPAEPVSREASPDQSAARLDDGQSRQVFCICRKIEAGMMIECEMCHEWYHYKCLKIARGKVKEDDKYTCPICDWRNKIPRDASRPKLEDLMALADEIPSLPFQPEEEEVLQAIIDNAQAFRDRLIPICNPIMSTEAEVPTLRFYLRKLEGAEVLLAWEVNFFRQQLHKLSPVAPEAPPILEVSLSTRKPRPTKLQKMLQEYGVDDPDDLPEHAKGKANSLRRKAANAEAAAAAAQASHGPLLPPSGSAAYGAPAFHTGHLNEDDDDDDDDDHGTFSSKDADVEMKMGDDTVQPALSEDISMLSLEERLLQGKEAGIDLESAEGKAKALEILGRTDTGREQAKKIFGSDVWGAGRRETSDAAGGEVSLVAEQEDDKPYDSKVDDMFKEVTNRDEEEEESKKDSDAKAEAAAEGVEKEQEQENDEEKTEKPAEKTKEKKDEEDRKGDDGDAMMEGE